MKKIITPHDRYFRAAMSDLRVAHDFFKHYLPVQIKEKVDFNTLRLCPESYVDMQLKLGITDILYSVQIAQMSGYIHLLVEHQSTPDYLMSFRIIKYICAIIDQHIKQTKDKVLPIVIPVVFYHGPSPYPYSTDFFNLFGDNKALAEDFLFKPFQLIDVGRIKDEEIRKHQWSGIMEFVTKHIFVRDLLPYLPDIILQLKAIEEFGGADYIITTLNYIFRTAEFSNKHEFIQVIETALSLSTGEKIMTLAEQWVAEGMEKGMEKGMEAGINAGMRKGKQETARKLLNRGHNIAFVAEITDLSVQEIMALQNTEVTIE